MSRLTDKFLFIVIVLVATLQFATSETQSQLADEKDHGNQFSAQLGQRKKKKGTTIKTFSRTS